MSSNKMHMTRLRRKHLLGHVGALLAAASMVQSAVLATLLMLNSRGVCHADSCVLPRYADMIQVYLSTVICSSIGKGQSAVYFLHATPPSTNVCNAGCCIFPKHAGMMVLNMFLVKSLLPSAKLSLACCKPTL